MWLRLAVADALSGWADRGTVGRKENGMGRTRANGIEIEWDARGVPDAPAEIPGVGHDLPQPLIGRIVDLIAENAATASVSA